MSLQFIGNIGMASNLVPEELIKFLNAGRTLEYDASKCTVGCVSLHLPDQIQFKEFGVNSQHNARWAEEDPHVDEQGDYIVRAYDLVAECEHYCPEGILIYVPELGVYGNHDHDHHAITSYPRVTWWNIVGDPIRFLTGCFRFPQLELNPILNPVGKFEFRSD